MPDMTPFEKVFGSQPYESCVCICGGETCLYCIWAEQRDAWNAALRAVREMVQKRYTELGERITSESRTIDGICRGELAWVDILVKDMEQPT